MPKLRDLATREDFDVGPLRVSPSRRLVEGPAGKLSLEPLIMQVFLLLLDSGGRVVTRDELFDQVWGGVMVGDDSLNRAIAKVRRIADAAPGFFGIETIPRTGYRLTGDILASAPAGEAGRGLYPFAVSRRALIGSAAAGAAAIAGIGAWSVYASRGRQFDQLMAKGRQALEYGDPAQRSAPSFRQAVSLRPDSAAAQGLLALALMVDTDTGAVRGPKADIQEVERAAATALAIDPNEPNARLARVALQRSVLDMEATERELRTILSAAPSNIFAMRDLWNLLQCGGRSREALALVEKALALRPLAAINNYPRAQLLWITGRTAEADRVSDSALSNWPEHRFVRFARFTILAFTDRARAAMAMIASPQTAPQNFGAAAVDLWKLSLNALDGRSPAAVAAARRENVEQAMADPRLTGQSVLTLSALGDLDSAFDVANKLLLFRQAVDAKAQGAHRSGAPGSTAWRFTPWLFTPPCAAMRGDPRFLQLCDGIGLTDYWNARRVRPDYQAAA